MLKVNNKDTKITLYGPYSIVLVVNLNRYLSNEILGKYLFKINGEDKTQPAITCSKLTTERLEQVMKYVQS